MRHYVFLKIPAKYDLPVLIGGMERILDEAQAAVPGFRHRQVLKQANPGTDAVSVLIALDFDSSEEKDDYLQHPLHLALLQQIKPVVMEKAVFDSTD